MKDIVWLGIKECVNHALKFLGWFSLYFIVYIIYRFSKVYVFKLWDFSPPLLIILIITFITFMIYLLKDPEPDLEVQYEDKKSKQKSKKMHFKVKWTKPSEESLCWKASYLHNTFEAWENEDGLHLFVVSPKFQALGVFYDFKEIKKYLLESSDFVPTRKDKLIEV